MKPQSLGDLMSPGSTLADVPPDFQGMRYKDWAIQMISKQCEEWRKANPMNPEDAPLSKKAVATPRDGYGMKGM